MRYKRHEAFKKIGKEGQKKLSGSTITIVGVGGTGSAAALYLAGAGANLKIIDYDRVELVNLHRQPIFSEKDVGKQKAETAAFKLSLINSEIKIECCNKPLTMENLNLLKSDFVIDGTDNMETRYLINEFCRKNRIPFSYGGAIRDIGMVTTVVPEGPCLKCLFPRAGEAEICCDTGVLGTVPAIVGQIEATEAIKKITGFGELLIGKLLTINVAKMEFNISNYGKRNDCPVCRPENL